MSGHVSRDLHLVHHSSYTQDNKDTDKAIFEALFLAVKEVLLKP